MYDDMKKEVLTANLLLPKYGLVTFTWGNVSAVCRKRNVMAIKPSGVLYETMTVDDIVIVNLRDGNKVDGLRAPSSDTKTHLHLYKKFEDIGGIVHTHSPWATIFAQTGRDIPALGTTHADYFYGKIPCTRILTDEEIAIEYEHNTGKVIAQYFADNNICATKMPAVLVNRHAPFTWGKDSFAAVHNAVVLEEVAKMAWHCFLFDKNIKPIDQSLLDVHFLRKHGANAYYGQK